LKLNILLFAGLVDKFGTRQLQLELLSKSITVGELHQHLMNLYPKHADSLKLCFFAINQQFANPEQRIVETDELALIPPVSGGEEAYILTNEPLQVEEITAKVLHDNHGASLIFIGTTREYTSGKRTIRLEYEAFAPMALKMLRQIGDEIDAEWPGARCAISHRLGRVEVGEASVVIAVSAPHRDSCYDASRYAIERLKQIVPIWKKESWDDGSEWIGHQLQHTWNPTV